MQQRLIVLIGATLTEGPVLAVAGKIEQVVAFFVLPEHAKHLFTRAQTQAAVAMKVG